MDGKRFLVIHGDLFEVVIRDARWLALLGNKAYDLAIWLNTWFNAARSCGTDLLVAVTVGQTESEERGQFHRRIREHACRRSGRGASVDGVICGHIHHAVIRQRLRHLLHQLRRLGGKLHSRRRHFHGRFEIVAWIGREGRIDEAQLAPAKAARSVASG